MVAAVTRYVALVLVLLVGAHAADAKPRKKRKRPRVSSRVVHPREATETPAFRYGHMTQDECEAELTTRGISFQREEGPAVLAPVRLLGPLHGVEFRTDLSAEKRATTKWEIADCRLVLALDDFAVQLAARDITEVIHYSMYRPPSKNWPEDKFAAQHKGAVAIDIGRFKKANGRVLDVDDHFSGRIGAKTCGDGARPRKKTPESTELRAILCDAVAANLFNIVLTPNFNRPHKNHFHLEVTGAKWFMIH
jgi:hypothetical protein